MQKNFLKEEDVKIIDDICFTLKKIIDFLLVGLIKKIFT